MSSTPTIQEALAGVMASVREVRKEERNEAQRFLFRGIDAVLNACGPALRQHGVIVMPTVLSHEYSTVEVGQKRTPMAHVIVVVDYTFTGPAGDSMTARVIGESMDSGDKAAAKAMSVAFRTALLQALALPTDDPDPDATSYERSNTDPVDVVAEFARRLNDAETADEISQVGRDIQQAGARFTDEQKEHLRAMYVARLKAVLGE